MGIVEVDHHRGDRMTERRSLLQPRWSFGRHAFAATGATTAEQADLGDVRLDGRQFDALVDLLWGLQSLGERRLAIRAGGQGGIDHPIRVRMQRPPDTRAALAWWASAVQGWAVLLLALRRWLGRIVRCLRRLGQFVQPCFECRDLLMSDPELSEQRQDQRILLRVGQLGEVGARDHPVLRPDSSVTVSSVVLRRTHIPTLAAASGERRPTATPG